MQELVSRQAQLETRQAIVASLAQLAEQLPRPAAPTASAPAQPRLLPQPAAVPLAGAARAQGGPVPDAASAYAPVAKPQPDPITLRGSAPSPAAGSGNDPARSRTSAAPVPEDATLRGAPPEQRIKGADIKLLRLETQQLATLTAFEARARQVESRYRGVLAELGLDRGRFAAAEARPQGGPFVPVKVDPNGGPFESLVYRLQTTLVEADRLRRTVEVLPLRRPLRGDADTTSGFGYRVDPFTRGMAMHTGIDFKDEFGAPVRATAAGTVSTAEWSGGYGNMVEIDHGHGLATRYAHLSALSVTEGQRVEVGTVVGRLGSTGRSTGPHLHYEMRVDGDAVDPLRWLRAGTRFGPF
jgi:murein DD-endopeptidase MepM/ murein hydrolase activator NlpD